ncbi:hypothetical protein [Lonepinella sp. BR2474]|uniref:hypothetical protein n=1 Tax=Lonepinella sp. BR2474 TaxID=3434548 RepID=UPI003F6DF1E6
MNNLNLVNVQIDTLEQRISRLLQPLNLLHIITNVNFDLIEPCELDDSLTGVKDLIQRSVDELNECVDLLRISLNKAENANYPPSTGNDSEFDTLKLYRRV